MTNKANDVLTAFVKKHNIIFGKNLNTIFPLSVMVQTCNVIMSDKCQKVMGCI